MSLLNHYRLWFWILILAILVTVSAGFQIGPHPATWTDRGGTVTTGGTSQTLMSANPNRVRVMIENPCSITSQGIAATENLFINFEGVAASTSNGKSIELQPCGSWDSGAGPVSSGAMTINAATTGHQFLAKEAQ